MRWIMAAKFDPRAEKMQKIQAISAVRLFLNKMRTAASLYTDSSQGPTRAATCPTLVEMIVTPTTHFSKEEYLWSVFLRNDPRLDSL